MTQGQDVAKLVWSRLSDCRDIDRRVTLDTVTHWLEYCAEISPDIPLMPERVQDDALLWASHSEARVLEVYLAAALMELERSAITTRAAKRLAAAAWRNMDVTTREAFKEWIGKQ